jgi:3-deoxy-7-phosphoheptulonate synthase
MTSFLFPKEEVTMNMRSEAVSQAVPVKKLRSFEPKIAALPPYRLASRIGHPEPTVVKVGNALIGGGDFTVIAGPCSVETEDQILSTARAVKECGAAVLRGGAFKPRTSPYSWQGLEDEGLRLLSNAGRAVRLPVVTEVMDSEDIPLVAAHADILQVGARNSQNFSLLKKIGSAGKPVLLKRGLMTTLDEFLMAAEYILAAGNDQVILCERGIRTFETSVRNTLDLMAVPVLKERTHLPVIVDPSHAAGKRAYVPALARAALAVGADGIMVEVHCDPDKALCDGAQSLGPADFRGLMADLTAVAPFFNKVV